MTQDWAVTSLINASVSACVCHTEEVVLTKQFVSATCFWEGKGRAGGGFSAICLRLLEADSRGFHSTVETGNPAGQVPSWCTHAASGMVGNKRDLSTVKTAAEATGEREGRRTIFDRVTRKKLMRAETRRLNVLSLSALTKRLMEIVLGK